MKIKKNHIALLCGILLMSSCSSNPKQETKVVGKAMQERMLVTLFDDYPEENDTLTLSELSDTVFYVRLEQPGLTDACQVYYSDSLILVSDYHQLNAFDAEGRWLYQLPNAYSMDVLPEASGIYLYNFKDRVIKKYGFDGKEQKTIRLRTEIDTYGRNFVVLSDSLFAISMLNVGYNPYELFWVNDKGEMVHRVKNREPFQPQSGAYTHNSIWHHRLFKAENGCRYYPSYSNTLYEVGKDATFRPVFVENKITKIPLEHRLEYSGQELNAYMKEVVANEWNAVRHFETSRFHFAEYKAGGHNFSLSNYLVYDKKSRKVHRQTNHLISALKDKKPLHFGISNDYDGGLAFAPSSQSGEYLIMVNASGQQGSHETRPRTLFQEGRTNGGQKYQVRSDVWTHSIHRQRLEQFFLNFDEEKHSMLMIVKMKK